MAALNMHSSEPSADGAGAPASRVGATISTFPSSDVLEAPEQHHGAVRRAPWSSSRRPRLFPCRDVSTLPGTKAGEVEPLGLLARRFPEGS